MRQWIEELRFNFWYDLNDLLWSMVFAGGLLDLFLTVETYYRG